MSKEYVNLVLAARKKMLKLTLKQQLKIEKIYEDAIAELAEQAKRAGDKTLSKRWMQDYLKQLEAAKEELYKELDLTMFSAVKKAGEYGVEPDLELFKRLQAKAGIDIGPHFTEMFSGVPDDVLRIMTVGEIYKDKRGLSTRIWGHVNGLEKDVEYMVEKGLLAKKSAYELAKDLEHLVEPAARRPWDFGNVYPGMRTKMIDYNAQRLARTSITHSYRESQYRSAAQNPFVEAIHWELSSEHYNRQVAKWGEDECDDYANQDWYGLGKGNFPVNEVPLSHPQCLCVTWPVIPETYDEIAEELKEWVDGRGSNRMNAWEKAYMREGG